MIRGRQGFNKKAFMKEGIKQGAFRMGNLQEGLEAAKLKMQQEKEKLEQKAQTKRAELEQRATEAKELVESKRAEANELVKSKQAEIQAEIAENKANMETLKSGPGVVYGRMGQGLSQWQKYGENAKMKMGKFKEDAGQAKKVLEQEAQRVHGEKVSSIMAGDSMAGDLAGLASSPKGGLSSTSPMLSMSGKSVSMGGRRRRRKSRRKKKKSKRKSRRKKTRKRKSRKSRNKRRKKSKKSRRRRRR